jgi:MATE family multidrug resistance protein
MATVDSSQPYVKLDESKNSPLAEKLGEDREEAHTVWTCLRDLVLKAGPSVTSFFLQFLVEIINMFYLGNIDKYRLDGIGLGNMWGNVTGLAIGWGLAGGLDTLCSQAYGNKDYRKVGVWL